MVIYILMIILFAIAIHQTLQPPARGKSRPAKGWVFTLGYSYLLLMATYLFWDKAFGAYTIQEIQITSVSRLYLFSIWCIVLFVAVGVLCILSGCRGRRRFYVTKSQARIGLTCGALFLAFFCAQYALNHYSIQSLSITEICTDEVVLPDASAKKEYIELYNPTGFTVRLSDCTLSDNPEDQTRSYSLPHVEIPAGGYGIVELPEEDAPFSIRNSGEDLFLLCAEGTQLLDQVSAAELPDAEGSINWVYAKNPATGSWEIQTPSPALANTPDKGKNPVLPQFSAEGGFYTDAFQLTLSAPEGYTVYYTLDSSIPDENATRYTQPISVVNNTEQPNVYWAAPNISYPWVVDAVRQKNVDKGFVVRAITVDSAGRKSDIVSKTYFVDLEQYRDGNVLSIVTDYDYLLGEDGICVTGPAYDDWFARGMPEGEDPPPNFYLRGREAEVPANVEMYQGSRLLLNRLSGLRLQGNSAREGYYKRLRLISRECYSGSRLFDFGLFDGANRSFYTREAEGVSADMFAQHLLQGTDVAAMNTFPAHVFVNGEYWYSWNLMEQYNEDWVSHRFDVDGNNVLISEVLPEEIITFVHTHDMTDKDAYDGLNQIMDLQSYIRFCAANIYYNNTDIGEDKNLRVWKVNSTSGSGYQDGRYRFSLYDLDYLGINDTDFNGVEHYRLNTFRAPFKWADNPYVEGTVFGELKKNEQFRRDFVLTFQDMANTCFEKEHVAECLEDLGADRGWNDGFFDHRAQYILPFLAEEFSLTGTREAITVSANLPQAGTIQINSVTPELTDGTWVGSYYTDYPITLSAQPAEGYAFVGWEHRGQLYEGSTREITLDAGDNTWQAQFQKIGA